MSTLNGWTLYADGWYRLEEDARAAMEHCESLGAKPVGIITPSFGGWGFVYWSKSELYAGHRIDGMNALASVLRKGKGGK